MNACHPKARPSIFAIRTTISGLRTRDSHGLAGVRRCRSPAALRWGRWRQWGDVVLRRGWRAGTTDEMKRRRTRACHRHRARWTPRGRTNASWPLPRGLGRCYAADHGARA
jgi:hypothetical protein